MSILKKHKGALAELMVTSWLLGKGREVFRNVSPHGPVDIIALDPLTNTIELIDVKTKNSTCTDNFLRSKNRVEGVKIISYQPESGEIKYET